jgi:CheY-like chemotaxis protein
MIKKGKGKVLLMDDEAVIRRATGSILKRLGYEVTCVEDGKEAIEEYKKEFEAGTPFKVVIMDLTVPNGIGGKEAIETLKEIDPNVKAIVSSGYSNDAVISEYKKYGFAGIAIKPYKVEELSNILARVIGEDE